MRHLVERETTELSDDELLDLYDGCAGTEQREDLRGEVKRRMNRAAAQLYQSQTLQGSSYLGQLGQLGGQGNG